MSWPRYRPIGSPGRASAVAVSAIGRGEFSASKAGIANAYDRSCTAKTLAASTTMRVSTAAPRRASTLHAAVPAAAVATSAMASPRANVASPSRFVPMRAPAAPSMPTPRTVAVIASTRGARSEVVSQTRSVAAKSSAKAGSIVSR